MRIVVTGGSGKAGRWVVRDLREQGHEVLNVDLVRDDGPHGTTLAVDLTDLGQCHDVIAGADAVVHLAAIPAPGLRAEGETFRNNILSTYNVFAAAVAQGVDEIHGQDGARCPAAWPHRRRAARARWRKNRR